MPIVEMNPFRRLWDEIGQEVLDATQEVGKSGWYVLGEQVRSFELEFAEYAGAEHSIGVANGMDAIEIGLRVLDIAPGDAVLTTPFTAFPTTLAIIRAGGVPVFADVDSAGLLDLEGCESLLSVRPDIRFMVPVHLYGQCLDQQRLTSLKEKFDLRIVEDAAQAHGASHGSRKVGEVGQVTAYSFYPTKNLGAFGDAGALTTRDPELAKRASSLRNYGQSDRYKHDELGLNSRLDELHAAILRKALLPRMSGWTQRRRSIAKTYLSELEGCDAAPLPVADAGGCVFHLFPVQVKPETRSAFMDHLKEQGIQCGVHYPLLTSRQGALRGAFDEQDFPRARILADSQVSLPIHPLTTDAEVERVIAACRNWRAKAGVS